MTKNRKYFHRRDIRTDGEYESNVKAGKKAENACISLTKEALLPEGAKVLHIVDNEYHDKSKNKFNPSAEPDFVVYTGPNSPQIVVEVKSHASVPLSNSRIANAKVDQHIHYVPKAAKYLSKMLGDKADKRKMKRKMWWVDSVRKEQFVCSVEEWQDSLVSIVKPIPALGNKICFSLNINKLIEIYNTPIFKEGDFGIITELFK